MKLIFYPDIELLPYLLSFKDQWDFLLDLKGLSRYGQRNLDQAHDLHKILKQEFILEWDALQTDHEVEERLTIFTKIQPLIKRVRLLDPGMSSLFSEDIELILDQGHCNLVSIESWKKFFGLRLKKVILSSQLSEHKLKDYVEKLQIPCEILGFGKILIFHSPRYLLNDQVIEDEAYLSSEETHHKNFYFQQSSLGTSMFAPKFLSLLSYLQELTYLDSLRIDLRGFSKEERLSIYQFLFEQKELKLNQPSFTGFFHQNKTDVLFKKLKNHHFKPNPTARVVDREKGSYLTLEVYNNFSLGDELELITPEGKCFYFKVQFFKKISSKIVLVNDQGVPTESLLYLKNSLE